MMKKSVFCALFLLLSLVAFALPKIAVLTPVMDKSIDESVSSPIMDKILGVLLDSKKFNVLDRASRDFVWEERNFQISSGEISNDEIKKVGTGLGAELVVVVKVKRVGTLFSLSTTMIKIETLELVAQASKEAKDSIEDLLGLAISCGEKIAVDYDGQALPGKGSSVGVARDSGDNSSKNKKPTTNDESDDGISDSSLKAEIRVALKSKRFLSQKGQLEISAKLGSLPISDKRGLYNEFDQSKVFQITTSLLNLTPFIKIGSFLQGDVGGALVFGALELGSVSLIGVGLFLLTVPDLESDGSTLAIGIASYIVFYIWGVFQPASYATKWNKSLERALDLGVESSYFEPLLRDVRIAREKRNTVDLNLLNFSL